MQAKVEQRNKRIAEMVDKACTKGGKSEKSHVRPLQALNLVDDGCERVCLFISPTYRIHGHA
jgi:hypothetical protein